MRFRPEGTDTRVELVHYGWEQPGRKAKAARRAYRLGWGYVLNAFEGRRTAGMTVLDLLARRELRERA